MNDTGMHGDRCQPASQCTLAAKARDDKYTIKPIRRSMARAVGQRVKRMNLLRHLIKWVFSVEACLYMKIYVYFLSL